MVNRDFLLNLRFFVQQAHMIVERHANNTLLQRVCGHREPVFLNEVCVGKLTVAHAELVVWVDVFDSLKQHVAFIAYPIMVRKSSDVRVLRVIHEVQQRRDHKNGIWVLCRLVRCVVEHKVPRADNIESPH